MKSKRFIRQARNSKGDIIRLWPRRSGKTFTLKKLAKKGLNKKAQFVNGLLTSKIDIQKDTQVVMLDEFTDGLIEQIKSARPDIKIIALASSYDTDKSELSLKDLKVN